LKNLAEPNPSTNQTRLMSAPDLNRPVERLFPFVIRARILLIGRETLVHRKSQLHFVLITEDVSSNSKEEMLGLFAHYPIVQRYTAADLQRFFRINGAKVVGFKKSGLAKSIYGELKQFRVNAPGTGSASQKSGAAEKKNESGPKPAV
jgi:hypothetical protein